MSLNGPTDKARCSEASLSQSPKYGMPRQQPPPTPVTRLITNRNAHTDQVWDDVRCLKKETSGETISTVKAQVTICPYTNFPEGNLLTSFTAGVIIIREVLR